jgi:hypothetical protein
VRGDVDEVVALMKRNPTCLEAEDYRGWPVFRGIRTDPKFSAAFEEVFKQPLLLLTKTDVEEPSEASVESFAPESQARQLH